MLGFGSSTVYKMVVKDDGSPNWIGIAILLITFGVVFVWRCMIFLQENWVGVRKRFGRVVYDKKTGMPVEYDPLANHPEKSGKKVSGIRLRFYLVNSIQPVNCGDRESDLGIKDITIGDHDFKTSLHIVWSISRDAGCPTKSIIQPAETSLSWRKSKDELPDLVVARVADAALRAYAELEKHPRDTPVRLPMLTVEDHMDDVKRELKQTYGVELHRILYKQASVAKARRMLESSFAIKSGLDRIAAALGLAAFASNPSSSDENDKPNLSSV